MKKQGFTLAEVLITLGIIGVVAAITLPGLNSNVNNRRIGPTLAKAINNLENANRMALVESGAVNLNDISSIRGVSDKPSYSQILASRLSGDITADSNGSTTFKGRDGITYTINNSLSGEKNSNLPEQYHGQYYKVTIDINGDKGPNSGGIDQFVIYSDLRGAVIPAGSNIAYKITPEGHVYSSSGSVNCNKEDVTPNAYCTNTVINDGWTVNYL